MPRAQTEPSRINADELWRMMERHEPVVILDSRNPQAWADADVMIPGALRVPADQVPQHLDEIPRGRPVVPYCT